jgi:Ras-related protein Rab-1A
MYMYQVMLVGDSGTGKSCLLMKYADNVFSEAANITVGIDFRVKSPVIYY